MKISPKQYILQKKPAYAAQLIRQGMPSTPAAMRVGYENYSNFYRMYRKHLQNTPSSLHAPPISVQHGNGSSAAGAADGA